MTNINTILTRYLSRLKYQFNKKDKDYFIDFLLNEISDVLPFYLNTKDVNFKEFYHKFKLGEDIFAELENDDFYRNLNPNNFPNLFLNYTNQKLDDSDNPNEEDDIPNFFNFDAKIQFNEEVKIKLRRDFLKYITKYILLVELHKKLSDLKSNVDLISNEDIKSNVDLNTNEDIKSNVDLNTNVDLSDNSKIDSIRTIKLNNIKNNLNRYGFNELTKIKNLSDQQKDLIFMRIVESEDAFKVALISELGFIPKSANVYFTGKGDFYNVVSKILDIEQRNFEGLVRVLSTESKENIYRYRTKEHTQDAFNFYQIIRENVYKA
jgi:hypothetical protein